MKKSIKSNKQVNKTIKAKMPARPDKVQFQSGKTQKNPPSTVSSFNSVAKESLIFVAIFAGLALPAYFAFSNAYELKLLAAYSSQSALSFLGVESQVQLGKEYADPLIVSEKFTAQINDLCAASVELAVLIGIIIASRDRSLAYRLKGIAAGFALVFLFNPVRIATTLYYYNPANPVASSIIHDFFFRASVIILIAAYYAVWYYWKNPSKIAQGKTN